MRFLEVNHQECVLCNDCYRACPTKAVSVVNGKISIDYIVCIACGICFKTCKKSAITLHIDTAKINALTQEAESFKVQKNTLDNLEVENKYLRNKIEKLERRFATLVDKLPTAVMAINRNGKVLFFNDRFASSLSRLAQENIRLAQNISDITIESLFDSEMLQIIKTALQSEQNEKNIEVSFDTNKYNLSVYPIRKEGAVLLFLRSLYDLQVAVDEIQMRVLQVVDQNMAMVQNIGFLMGEEAAKSTRVLNSIVDILNAQKKQ